MNQPEILATEPIPMRRTWAILCCCIAIQAANCVQRVNGADEIQQTFVTSVAFSSDGKLLAVARNKSARAATSRVSSLATDVLIYRVEDWKLLQSKTLTGGSDGIAFLSEDVVVAGGADRKLWIWNRKTDLATSFRSKAPATEFPTLLSASADGSHVVLNNLRDGVELWSVKNPAAPELRQTFAKGPAEHGSGTTVVLVDRQGDDSDESSGVVWIEYGKPDSKPVRVKGDFPGHTPHMSVCKSKDLVAGRTQNDEGEIAITDLRERKSRIFKVGKFDVMALALNSSGSQLATSSWKGQVKVHDLETREELGDFDYGAFPRSIVFSPDDRLLVVGGGDPGNMAVSREFPAKIWDLRSKRLVAELK